MLNISIRATTERPYRHQDPAMISVPQQAAALIEPLFQQQGMDTVRFQDLNRDPDFRKTFSTALGERAVTSLISGASFEEIGKTLGNVFSALNDPVIVQDSLQAFCDSIIHRSEEVPAAYLEITMHHQFNLTIDSKGALLKAIKADGVTPEPLTGLALLTLIHGFLDNPSWGEITKLEQETKIQTFYLKNRPQDSIADALASQAFPFQGWDPLRKDEFETYASLPNFKNVFTDQLAYHAIMRIVNGSGLNRIGQAMGAILTTIDDDKILEESLQKFTEQLKINVYKLPDSLLLVDAKNETCSIDVEQKNKFTDGLQSAGLSRDNGRLLIADRALEGWATSMPFQRPPGQVPSPSRLNQKLAAQSKKKGEPPADGTPVSAAPSRPKR